jgi:hypothetical protein
VSLDPEVLRHDTVAFTAGTRTELVKLPTRELFGREGATTVSLVKRPERASDDPVGAGRRSRPWQAAASRRRDGLHDATTSPSPAVSLGGRAESERVWESSERGGAGRKDLASMP